MSSKAARAMSEGNNEKSAQVPLLRFPEFRDAEEWEGVSLSTQVDLISGLHLAPDKYAYTGEIPYFTGPSDYSNELASVSKWTTRGANAGRAGDTLITVKGNGVGELLYLLLDEVAMGRQLMAVRPRIADGRFVFHFLATQRQRLIALASGNLIPGLSRGDILGLKVLIPENHEQQKIADCLSSLDDLITAETQKLDALKTHKKGLVQQLFPREGETVPRLRFPEFRGAGSWSKVPAGELFSNRIERGRSGLPIYSVTMTDGLVPRASLDRKIDDIAETGANKTACSGDLAYNMMRMWQGAVGVAPEDCMVSPAYIVLEPQGVNPLFFYFLLKLPPSLRVLTAHSRGLTEDRLRLYYDDFAKVALQCPPLPEQDRIADCLMSVDKLITAQGKKIDALKTHKKGLMQQLFPSREEIE